jgi:hypothetical protein
MGKSAPKFPTNGSLSAVDLDNEIIGTCKSQECGGISVQLFVTNRSDIELLQICPKTKPPGGVWRRRLCHAGSGWGQFPVQSRYRFRVTPQRNSLVKLNAGAAG